MKRYGVLFIFCALVALLASGCGLGEAIDTNRENMRKNDASAGSPD